jgi:hypothetical protein
MNHWPTHQLNLPGIGLQQLANDLKHRGLTTPIRTQQADDISTRHLQAKAIEHLLFAEPLEQAINLQGNGHTF